MLCPKYVAGVARSGRTQLATHKTLMFDCGSRGLAMCYLAGSATPLACTP
jgi:hypothetical protein